MNKIQEKPMAKLEDITVVVRFSWSDRLLLIGFNFWSLMISIVLIVYILGVIVG